MDRFSFPAIFSLLIAATFATPVSAQYCSTRPPPDGLVARCQHLNMVVPSSRTEFELLLLRWMESCAVRSRGAELVIGNESVDEAWSLIEDKRYTPYNVVRILPRYTPNQWRRDDRTCYGVGSVEFVVAGSEGIVEEGEIEVLPADTLTAFTDDQIKSAIRAAESALQAYPGDNAWERSRMQNILARMASYGSDFNDMYYKLAPEADILGNFNPPACFKESDARGQLHCSLPDAARDECRRHFGPNLLRWHLSGMSQKELADRLLIVANDIARAKQYLMIIQGVASPAAVPCPSIKDVFMPEIGSLASDPKSLYNAWDAGP